MSLRTFLQNLAPTSIAGQTHPICIIKEAIYSFFDERRPGVYAKLDDLYPVVSAKAVSVCSLWSDPLTI